MYDTTVIRDVVWPRFATSKASRPRPTPGTRTLILTLKKISSVLKNIQRCRDAPFFWRYVREVFDESIFHGLIAALSFLFSLCLCKPSVECDWQYRYGTSSLQSRTNCLMVLRSLSMSKSVGLYRFCRSDEERLWESPDSWAWVWFGWSWKWLWVCECPINHREAISAWYFIGAERHWPRLALWPSGTGTGASSSCSSRALISCPNISGFATIWFRNFAFANMASSTSSSFCL